MQGPSVGGSRVDSQPQPNGRAWRPLPCVCGSQRARADACFVADAVIQNVVLLRDNAEAERECSRDEADVETVEQGGDPVEVLITCPQPRATRVCSHGDLEIGERQGEALVA